MQNQTTLARLSDKVSAMVDQYKMIKEENEALRVEMVKLQAQNELKNQEIEKLTEQNALKDSEIESIVEKLESIMA
ncbi:MAG: hypothetical protein PHX44_01775 [Sulfurimonas sp.]|uniref:hypothetical protein n=1 Tax=Sulfurimonas sp. TaxID=2022749 RepID=UPI00261CC4B9|nr:hypothetical protein [Sulfurimonas sp.]MDD2651763.1 hypothetical protein [Sulfurimonas sp.]MDD3451685.1 hypothetical protein [Sulfurimonas sp.]